MNRRRKIFLLFFCFAFQLAEGQYKDTLYTWGLPNDEKVNATKFISDKWNIYRYGYGCVVTDVLTDSLTKMNEITYKRLIPKYGIGWLDRYYEEIDKETEIQLKIDTLVKNQPFMVGLSLYNQSQGIPLPKYPIDKNWNYIVTVNHYYGKDWKEQKIYKLLANYKRKSVKILKDYTLDK